jgi:antitoxin component of RelBE/YafQ-DinJ toxin-antitoxin module
MADNKDRFNMRIEGDFKDRLERLKKKHGIDGSSVVKMAVAQMAERDLPPAVKEKENGRKSKA